MSKGKKRRLRLTALGLILLGLWGMLALLLGVSVGKEARYRANLKVDLQPGFGETHATLHPLDGAAGQYADKDLFVPCVVTACLGAEEGGGHTSHDRPVDDGADDATSSLGRGGEGSSRPDSPPSDFARDGAPGFPNSLFIPGFAGRNPNPAEGENPNGPGHPNPSDNFTPPDSPGDTPPLNLTQPPFFDMPEGGPDSPTGPEGGSDDPNGPRGPEGPGGPDGPNGPTGPNIPDQPIHIPEPLTLSLFATGVAGLVLLRRRKTRASK